MLKRNSQIFFLFSFTLILSFSFFFLAFSQRFTPTITETVTLVTYYPSSAGIYELYGTRTLGVGDTNGDGSINASDAPDPTDAAQSGDVWVAGNVGIGSTAPNPQNNLDISGNAVIGAGYAGSNAAPANGLLVEGGIGIRTTTTAGNALSVNGEGAFGARYHKNAVPPNGLLVEGDVLIGRNIPGSGTKGDLEVNNTLRLSPTDTPNHAIRGDMYYDDSENTYKLHDGTGWQNVGQELGAPVEYQSAQLISNGTRYDQNAIVVGLEEDCPAGTVLTGIRIYTRGWCPFSCNFWSGNIHHLGLMCSEL